MVLGRNTMAVSDKLELISGKAACLGDVQDILRSWNSAEMKPENLSGAGNALRELGVI